MKYENVRELVNRRANDAFSALNYISEANEQVYKDTSSPPREARALGSTIETVVFECVRITVFEMAQRTGGLTPENQNHR